MLGRDAPAFYATKYYIWAWNRYYKIYLTPRGLSMAFLAKKPIEDLMMPDTAADTDTRGASAADRLYEREIAADASDLSSAAFMNLHKLNLRFDHADIAGWAMTRRPVPFSSVRVGILKLMRRGSKPITLIAVGDDADLAEDILETGLGPQS